MGVFNLLENTLEYSKVKLDKEQMEMVEKRCWESCDIELDLNLILIEIGYRYNYSSSKWEVK